MKLMRRMRAWMSALAVLVAGVCMTPAAGAIDKIHLKDGRVVEGTVKEELDGYVWFVTKVGGVETEVLYKPEQISKIERDAGSPSPVDPQGPQSGDQPIMASDSGVPARTPRFAGGTKAAVLTLGERQGGKDMVGIFVTADSIRRCIPLLEEELGTDGTGILVLRVNSGGGALLEIQKLSDVIEYELKPKFRVVAWIDWAISAAAMTSHAVEEIYFTRRGNYGACTGWFGALQAVTGRDLEDVLFMMEKISARGKHDPIIMRAMQIMEPLSCSIDENGEVKWFKSLDGDYIVNEPNRILTFNSETAAKYKFSKGTADTIEELAQAMRVPEINWVGEWIDGVDYPVCKAEKEMRRFRDQTKSDQDRTNEYFVRYQQSIAMAQGTPREERGKFVNKAREALDLIVRMVRNNPNFHLFVFNMATMDEFNAFVEEQRQLLRDLMK